jgi:imidazolonepropionase-like amidohydrolase
VRTFTSAFIPFTARLSLSVAALCSLAIGARAQGAPDVYAITNARIVPSAGKVIEKGTIVLRDGLIVAVGSSVTPPADARVIDGNNLTVYPALINGYSQAGMPGVTDYPATPRGDGYAVAKVRSENTAPGLLRADPAAFSALHRAGFGATLSAPYVGIFSGTSAVLSLGAGTEPSSLVVKSPVAMHMAFFAADPAGGYPGSLMGQIALARQALFDAQYAARLMDAYEKDPNGKPRPNVPRAMSALRPVLDKKMPLVMQAEGAQDIRRALKLASEFGVRPIIAGATEAYAVMDELKKADAAVLLSAALPEAPRIAPGEDDPSTLQGLRRRALAQTAAAALAKAGIPFAITTSGMNNVSDFTRNVRKFIAGGLSEDDALTAVTLSPAKLLGVDRQLGTLDTGKIANVLVVENGSLFSARGRIKYLFVDGKKVNIDTAAPVVAASEGGGPGGPGGSGGRRRPSGGGAPGGTPPATGAPTAPPVNIASQLPPGVTPEQALQFLRQNPQAARSFLPAGVTVEQAIASLEGGQGNGQRQPTARTEEEIAAPPAVGTTLVPPLPPQVGISFVLRDATVWTSGPQGILKNADVHVQNGKIMAVGPNLKVPSGTVEIDAKGKHVTPGMIDCHSHSAIDGGVNEGSNIVTAEVRIQDVIDPEDVNIYRQLAGGTTAANLLHGSANAIGGQNAVVKWRWGASAEDMIVKGAPLGIKFALGENPTRSNGGISRPDQPRRYPATRMGVEKVIRAKFMEGRDYQARWKAFREGRGSEPRRDIQLDAIVEILEGKRLVHCHSYRADEILMMTRLADEFGFKIATFQHVLEGYKVADEMAKHGAGGSTFSDWWGFKIEAYDAIPYNGALMNQRGVLVSFNSDDSELARRLNLEAAKAVRYGGISPAEALKFVTINPAKQLRIDKMTGSLEVGKDADIVVWSSDPLSTLTVCEKTFVDGKLYFDRKADIAARTEIEAEKKRLAAALNPTQRRAAGAAPTASTAATATTAAAAPVKPMVPTASTAKPVAAKGPVTAIVGATIHPLTGPEIPNGVLVTQGGIITAVGPTGKVAIPSGAKKVDAKGLHVYPGMTDADTTVGVNEIGSRRETQDYSEIGDFKPELRVAVAVNPDAETIRVARLAGVLNVVTTPTGGTLSGMGALLNLNGWTWEEMSVKPTLGLFVNFPGGGGRRFGEVGHRCEETADGPHDHGEYDDPLFRSGAYVPAGSRDNAALRYGFLPEPQAPQVTPSGGFAGFGGGDAALRPLNNYLDDARRYRDARKAETTAPRPTASASGPNSGNGANGSNESVAAAIRHDRDPGFEAMLPVLDGKVPMFVRADRARDIRTAVSWAKKEGFPLVIVGGREADECADLLVKENVPVILGPVLALPRQFDSAYDSAFTLPARLAKAGVRFCLSTGSASDVRRLPQHAAMAAAYGLDPEEALKAITLYPAQILGVGDQLGSLAPGRSANFILTTGNPLEVISDIKAAYVAGEPVDLTSRQTILYDRWRARPKK